MLRLALLLVTAQLSGAVPLAWARTPPPACGPSFTVVSANLLMVHPDPDALAAELRAFDADVYLFQEYSARWEAELRGLRRHRFVNVQDDSFGTAIYSRFPLRDAQTIGLGRVLQATAFVDTPLGPVEVLDVHTLPPRSLAYLPIHREGLRDVEGWIRTARGDALVAGDFNAGPSSSLFRRLRDVADDAWALGGTGPGYTWPNGVFPLPPARLDHVLVSKALTVATVEVGTGIGSDHRPIHATIARRCE